MFINVSDAVESHHQVTQWQPARSPRHGGHALNAEQMITAQFGRGSILFGVHKVDLTRW
jgi:hypothetical protein